MKLNLELIEKCIKTSNYPLLLAHLENVKHPLLEELQGLYSKNMDELPTDLFIENIHIPKEDMINLQRIMKNKEQSKRIMKLLTASIALIFILVGLYGVHSFMNNQLLTGIFYIMGLPSGFFLMFLADL